MGSAGDGFRVERGDGAREVHRLAVDNPHEKYRRSLLARKAARRK